MANVRPHGPASHPTQVPTCVRCHSCYVTRSDVCLLARSAFNRATLPIFLVRFLQLQKKMWKIPPGLVKTLWRVELGSKAPSPPRAPVSLLSHGTKHCRPTLKHDVHKVSNVPSHSCGLNAAQNALAAHNALVCLSFGCLSFVWHVCSG